MQKITLTIPMRIWSQNQSDRAHWAKRLKVKKDWRRMICLLLLSSGPRRRPTEHRTVYITSYRTHLLDQMNLIGGAKSLADAMVELHLLRDDCPTYATFVFRQEKCKRDDERTVIEIEGNDDGEAEKA